MNCNSQEFAVPILFCPSAQLGHHGARGGESRGGGWFISCFVCVCIEDQIRCPGTVSSPYPGAEKGLFVCDLGLWHQRDKECSLCEDRGGGGGEPRVWDHGVWSTRVLISSVFMSTHYRKHRCRSGRLHGTGQTGVGGTLSPHRECVHMFSI